MCKTWLIKLKQYLLRQFYYTDEGNPKKCEFCGYDKFWTVTVDDINGTICEYRVICKKCRSDVGYWGYGYFDPSYPDHIFERTYGDTLKCLS